MPKYCTKIDTGIQLNNLTQEVNMPLLRLAEVYMNKSSTFEGATVNCSKIKHGQKPSNNSFTAVADCWRYMDSVLE